MDGRPTNGDFARAGFGFGLSADVAPQKKLIGRINSCPYLLPAEFAEKPSRGELSYDAGNMISLSEYFERNRPIGKSALGLAGEICALILRMESDGFFARNCSYDPDYIYVDTADMSLRMTLFPFETGRELAPSLRNLMSFIFGGPAASEGGPDFGAEIIGRCDSLEFSPQSLLALVGELYAAEDYDRAEIYAPSTRSRFIDVAILSGGSEKQARVTSFPCVLGRSPQSSDIVLEDSGVSRRHAAIDLVDGVFVVVDCDSSNGVLVNGKRLDPGIMAPLDRGDIIKLGRSELRITGAGGA